MTRIGDIGTTRLINWDVKASFYVSLALIKKSDQFASEYIKYFMDSKHFQNELYKRTLHTAFPKKINLREIGKCKVKLPSFPEQQKIANFLSVIDNKIELEKKKLKKIKAYKKGFMQKIFI